MKYFKVVKRYVITVSSMGLLLGVSACNSGTPNETIANSLNPNVNQWSLVGGSPQQDVVAQYGESASSPGSRNGSLVWQDHSGMVWLFGGASATESSSVTKAFPYSNDLWKFDPTSNQWQFVGGSPTGNQGGNYGSQNVASSSNSPGARANGLIFVDSKGNLWLFGGYGYPDRSAGDAGTIGALNDLWEYDTTKRTWKWVSGSKDINQVGNYLDQNPANLTPGARSLATGWIDANDNIWVFGGFGYSVKNEKGEYSSGRLNDLWKFDTSHNQWTFVSKNQPYSEGVNSYGNYDNNNNPYPGTRSGAIHWLDTNGQFWLFGGSGFAAESGMAKNSGVVLLNDLWTYNADNNQWLWVGGSDLGNQYGSFGTQGSASSDNLPSAREKACAWVDAESQLWLYGGVGLANANSGSGSLSDLWKFDLTTREWTWVSGANIINQPVSYGIPNQESATNTPGGRYFAASWLAPDGGLLTFSAEISGIQQDVKGYSYTVLKNCSLFNENSGQVIAGAKQQRFYVHNNLPDYIVSFPINNYSPSFNVVANPDLDKLIPQGYLPSVGQGSTFNIVSPDAFQGGSSAYVNPSYGNFSYNAEANTKIVVAQAHKRGGDTVISTVATCPITVYVNGATDKVALASTESRDIVPCKNSNFYVQDDNNGVRINSVFVSYGQNQSVYHIMNNLPSKYFIKLASVSAANCTDCNPDNNSWESAAGDSSDSIANAGETVQFMVNSSDKFSSSLWSYTNAYYTDFNYNSVGSIRVQIRAVNGGAIIAECNLNNNVYINGNIKNLLSNTNNRDKPQIVLAASDGEDRVNCGQSSFYVQDDRNTPGGSLDTLFVHYNGN